MTTFYALIDPNGFPTAWFNDDLSPPAADGSRNSDIPEDAQELSRDVWLDCISNSGARIIRDGKSVAYVPPVAPISESDVDRERDRRMFGGFVFGAVVYQTDAQSISNILGAAQLAFMAIVGGAKAGDMTWAGGSTPFAWIAADNAYHPMDAYTVVAFAKAAAAFRSQIIYMARACKDALAAGKTIDVTADATWGVDSTSPTSTAAVSGASQTTATSPATATASGASQAAPSAA